MTPRRSKPSRKAALRANQVRAQAPEPRRPVPITRAEVIKWANEVLRETLSWDGKRIPPRVGEWLLNLQHSVEWMLNPEFLAAFNEGLYGAPNLERRRHFDPVDYPTDADLRQRWKVREIAWPAWVPTEGQFDMLAEFPVPVIHWRAHERTTEDAPATSSSRGPVHHWAMRPHSQYLLICSSCDSPQGPRGGADILNSKAPTLRGQLDRVGQMAARGEGPGAHPKFLPFWLSVQHELWGGFAFNLAPGGKSPDDLRQDKNRLHYLFDQALDLWGTGRYEWLQAGITEDLAIVAWILGHLQCRVCSATGTIRYLPQILSAVELHLPPSAQAKRVASLASKLRSSRPESPNDVRHQVFWFPDEPPRQRPNLLAKRVATALARADQEVPLVLLADWLIPIARRGETYWTDRIEIEALEQVPEKNQEGISASLHRLREDIAALPRSTRISTNADRLRALIAQRRNASVVPTLLGLYRRRELGERISDRKYKASRRSRPAP